MSWGERSCIKPCRVPESCTIHTCNTGCSGYRWNGKTKPDKIGFKLPLTIEEVFLFEKELEKKSIPLPEELRDPENILDRMKANRTWENKRLKDYKK